MKLRFVAVLILLLTATLCSVSVAGPISHFCQLHPKAGICQP